MVLQSTGGEPTSCSKQPPLCITLSDIWNKGGFDSIVRLRDGHGVRCGCAVA